MSINLDKNSSNVTMLDWSTLKFVGLNILTVNTLLLIWTWKIVNTISNAEAKKSNLILAICLFACGAWSDYIIYIFTGLVPEDSAIFLLSGLLMIASCVLWIVLSLKINPDIEKFLQSEGKPYKPKIIWSIIFPFYYQYYLLYNRDKLTESTNLPPQNNGGKSLAEQIARLKELKDQGALSDKEFEEAKNKLLSKN